MFKTAAKALLGSVGLSVRRTSVGVHIGRSRPPAVRTYTGERPAEAPLPPLDRRAQRLRVAGVTYTDAPRWKNYVFICGLHRSGTTLLERLLVTHLDLAHLRADVAESEGQHMQDVYTHDWMFGWIGQFAYDALEQIELQALDDHPACFERIRAQWSRFAVGDSETLIEKTPSNLTKIWWLRRVFPGARFIVLTRDPRAATAAQQGSFRVDRSLPDLMMHWNAAYSRALADFDAADCMHLRYEDVVADQAGAIDAVADFCNIPRRAADGAMPERFAVLKNSNPKYIRLHEGRYYGRGAWDSFGYALD